MSDIAIPFSVLRSLHRQAYSTWLDGGNNTMQAVFRSYVREEIARRTIAAQEQRIRQLEMDSIYLNEVAGPAIDLFQQRDREQKATIAELRAQVERLTAELAEHATGDGDA
jgi:hypothetical protein